MTGIGHPMVLHGKNCSSIRTRGLRREWWQQPHRLGRLMLGPRVVFASTPPKFVMSAPPIWRPIAAYLESQGLAPDRLASIRSVYEKPGLREYWRHELAAEVAKGSKPGNAGWMATIYRHLGDKEKSLEYLTRGSQQQCGGLQFLKVDPLYDGLRDDPRFKEIIAQLWFPQEAMSSH